MRTLTITRNKTFVGCAGKIRLYVEDYTSPETTILDTPCRLLGTLKNGETQSFEIPEEAVKIFAIADKVSKSYCNEFYPLPAGFDPVTLAGQCRYNPATGNAFRFEGVTDEEVLANRRRGSKKGIVVLIAAFAVGVLIGLVSTGILFPEKAETFTHEQFSITLTNRFDSEPDRDFVAVYEADEALVMISNKTFASAPELTSMSVTTYNQYVQQGVQAPSKTPVRTEEGLCYFDYTANIDGDDFTYRAFAFKGSDAFWLVQIVTCTSDFADAEADIMEWAKSFTLN